ncbi:carbohydrate ABC transporter permease [Vagococcus fluvialis]|uniref:Carbohydrate ABC transporter permease n=1 Tax=Vagococcus fluvialis TaxID=2738 RepID=A0A7X6DB78_9ENTE|nr:carbohydrate ABC transporter permease [Vagococcus fluvialis]NKC69154.1 carbohydrate ABC transporter permease [Vagococcus fluvialis]
MKRISKRPSDWISLIVLSLMALTMVIPILNILAKSLTSPENMQQMTGLSILPKGFTLMNYKILFDNPNITRSIIISVVLTLVGTTISLIFTAIAAYILTRPNFVGKNFFMLFLIIMMVFEPGLIQEYFVVRDLGLLDSFASIILYKTIDVYYLIILMRFFEEIPHSIIESAEMDGASHISIFTKIVLPLSKSAMATMGLFYGVFRWNEYFRASIYLTSPSKWPLQVLMRQFVVLNDTSSMMNASGALPAEVLKTINFESLKSSTIIVSIIPLLLLYPIILKHYTKGTLDGGVKE